MEDTYEIEVKQPSIRVIAAGGCGTNLLKKLLKTGISSDLEYMVIDTSQSNYRMLPKYVEVHSISDLGSGKDRSRNVTSITRYLDTHKNFVTEAADITIVLFSMAGGSGSVIAPLLAHRLMRHSDRAVVLIGIADDSSKRDCINTINTIKTLSKFATDNNYYLPLMLFSNTEVGRVAVNETATRRLSELIDMLTNKAISEIDYTDKMNYLRPTNVGCPAGCYMLFVTESDPAEGQDLPGEMRTELVDGDMVHACLLVNDTGKCPRILTQITYVGISEYHKFFSTIGSPIPKDVVDELNIVAEQYSRNDVQKDNTETTFGSLETHEDGSGLIL